TPPGATRRTRPARSSRRGSPCGSLGPEGRTGSSASRPILRAPPRLLGLLSRLGASHHDPACSPRLRARGSLLAALACSARRWLLAVCVVAERRLRACARLRAAEGPAERRGASCPRSS